MAKKCARTFSIVVEKGKKSILDVGHLLPVGIARSVRVDCLRLGQCDFRVGQPARGDEVCVATAALRKLRFSTNHSGHKRASSSRLRARSARAGSDSRAVARRAATFW